MANDMTIDATTDPGKPALDLKGKPRSKSKPKAPIESKGKRSLNLSIDHDTYQRLALHALDADTTISEIVSELARTHLRRVHLTRTTTRATTDTPGE